MLVRAIIPGMEAGRQRSLAVTHRFLGLGEPGGFGSSVGCHVAIIGSSVLFYHFISRA
jgi:hypothetical protein